MTTIRPSLRPAFRPHVAALIVLAAAVATIGGALFFEHALGYSPCKLCLTQRVPYYLTIPLTVAGALLPARFSRFLLGLIALIMLYGAGLAVYHAGAEWSFWRGPSDCGGGTGPNPAEVQDFLKTLDSTRVVECTTAAWRFLGLSLAGWNAAISVVLAALAGIAALRREPAKLPARTQRLPT